MKFKIIAAFLFLTFAVKAQFNVQFGKKIVGDQKAGIYKTFIDLSKDSIEYRGEQDKTKGTRSWIMLGKSFVMFKKADFYGYKDYFGNRYRIFNGQSYNVLSFGKMNLYSVNYELNCREENGKTPTERCVIGDFCPSCGVGQRYKDGTVELFYSTSPDGELIELKKWQKKDKFEIANTFFLGDEKIKAEFLNDNKEDYSNHDKNGALNELERLIFYLNKINGITNN
jgi:hypothetical protein